MHQRLHSSSSYLNLYLNKHHDPTVCDKWNYSLHEWLILIVLLPYVGFFLFVVCRFSTGIQLARFVTSSIFLRKSWNVITSRYEGIISTLGEGLSWKVCKEPDSDLTIIAFDVTQEYSSNLQPDLVPSNALTEKNLHHFEFLCTMRIPLFSVNNNAISLFCKNHQRLDQLRSEVHHCINFVFPYKCRDWWCVQISHDHDHQKYHIA